METITNTHIYIHTKTLNKVENVKIGDKLNCPLLRNRHKSTLRKVESITADGDIVFRVGKNMLYQPLSENIETLNNIVIEKSPVECVPKLFYSTINDELAGAITVFCFRYYNNNNSTSNGAGSVFSLVRLTDREGLHDWTEWGNHFNDNFKECNFKEDNGIITEIYIN